MPLPEYQREILVWAANEVEAIGLVIGPGFGIVSMKIELTSYPAIPLQCARHFETMVDILLPF
jgi:hypothetical protein